MFLSIGTISLINGGAGSLSLTGTAGTNNGVTIASNTNVATSGNVSISGTSLSGTGVVAAGNNAITMTSGALTLTGATSSSAATGFDMSASGTVIVSAKLKTSALS